MKFLANENFPLPSVFYLREQGHEVISISELSPGIHDEAVLKWAEKESAIILTFDSDYGSLIYRNGLLATVGVLYLRFVPRFPTEAGEQVQKLILLPTIKIEGNFTTATREHVRQRPLI